MATRKRKSRKSRKSRKTRRRSCKNGKLKRPIRTKSGRKRRCKKKKAKKRSKKRKSKKKRRRSRRKYKMRPLKELASRNVADNLKGDIDQRIEQVEKLNIPYNSKIEIINRLEEDKQLISEFYEAKVNRQYLNAKNIFIRYITSSRFRLNKNNKVKTVLKYYPQYLNAKNGRDTTALIAASYKSDTEIVRMLLDRGADPNIQNKTGDTALMAASNSMVSVNTEIVRMLLKAGADPNIQNNKGETALMMASFEGHTEIVEMLLDAGADVNARDNEDYTALMYATDNNHTEIVEMLLDAGADRTEYDEAILYRQKEERARDILEELHDNNWDVYNWFRESDIMSRYLFDNNVDVNYLDTINVYELYQNQR